ncbi:hypothetical protein [Parasitella parasitica]|uniref:Piwi domain-containing protein n=1 Tax=Parasitella parasitica TaxID=35722 RepID=A0A0B7N4I9_9FUNG|nr:hypothetical protein [Parasitella parasitica]
MALQLTNFALRPNEATLGRATQVRTNFFQVLALPYQNVYHYDIEIQPIIPRAKKQAFWKFFEETRTADVCNNSKSIFDGARNVFSVTRFNLGETQAQQLKVDVGSNPVFGRAANNIFTITIKFTSVIRMQELQEFLDGESPCTSNCLSAIMVLDILVRFLPSLVHFTFGRSILTPTDKTPLPNGAEAWHGFYQSVRPAKGRMLVNIDTTATVVHESGPLPEIAAKILNKRSLDDLRRGIAAKDLYMLTRLLKGRQIQVVHRGEQRYTYKITNLAAPANEITFTDAQGTSKTVADYFVEKYNRRLNYPFLPCVVVRRDIFLPMEVCEITPGQRYTRKLNPKQTAEFIKATSKPPQARVNTVNRSLSLLGHKNNPYMEEFGMNIKQEMEVIKARVLPAPKITFHPSQGDFTAQAGGWNLQSKKLAKTATLVSWSIINFAVSVPFAAIQRFVRELCQTAAELGINVVNREPPIMSADPQGNIERNIKEAYIRAGQAVKCAPQMLVLILPVVSGQLYGEIKRISDTVVGVPTQCIQSKHIASAKKQYCANLCLKINVKLGGMNHSLKTGEIPFISEKPTIIFGIDVSHGMPNSKAPSIAAVTASVDALAVRFISTIRLQEPLADIVSDLTNIVVELLQKFYKETGVKPERMIFYRDGVANNQFTQVMETEVAAIRHACAMLDINYKPTITFIVVQKRHRARFFPIGQRDADRNGNCMPGVVIDTDVVHPFEFDFYLQSHTAIKGTARAAHYYVLHDQNNFSADDLQDLSYKLTHVYARSCGPVSLVPAVYYADLVAARARFHRPGGDWSDTTASSEMTSEVDLQSMYAVVKQELQNTMYFM